MRTTLAKLALVCLSTIFIGLIFTNLSDAKIDQKTIAGVWLFDEGKGEVAKDSSGNGNDGKFVGNPKWVEGKLGKALEFDGKADHLNCGKSESLNLTKSLTLMAWAKYSVAGPRDLMNHTGCQGYFLYLDTPGNVCIGQQCNADTLKVPPISDKNWHHIAGTYDGTTAKLYIDGELKAEGKKSWAFSNPGNFHIACAGDRGDELFQGTLDEVAFFNVALSADDVKDIATNGLGRALGYTAVSPIEKLTITWGRIKAEN